MRQAAQLYTEAGWIIHPIKPPEPGNKRTGKAPWETGWQHRIAPRSSKELDDFFSDGRNNIGLLCGRASGVTVLDIDDDLFLGALTKDIPQDQLVISAREGEIHRGHLFFKHEPDLPSQKHHQLGLEILSDGNNCVLPPSIHYSGTQYRWSPGGPGPEALPVMAPELKARLIELFKIERKMKNLLGHARPCFRKFMESPEPLHGGDGRQFMVALITELSATAEELNYGREERDKCIHLAARLIYRNEYDHARTDKELQGIDSRKPWRCETLAEHFMTGATAANANLSRARKARQPKRPWTRSQGRLRPF